MAEEFSSGKAARIALKKILFKEFAKGWPKEESQRDFGKRAGMSDNEVSWLANDTKLMSFDKYYEALGKLGVVIKITIED